MKLYTWNDILSILNGDSSYDFLNGAKTGISTGSFDGLHKGHRKLISELTAACKKKALVPGVITFTRPLPSIKHNGDYRGDLTTLNQRLSLLEELGVEFAVTVDFDDSFASMMGSDFLNILLNVCNMELIAEGIDFRCGYKGATDAQAIKYWAEKNKIDTVFVDPVYFNEERPEEERISSSYIRTMLSKGFFTTASQLLEHPYELDIEEIKRIKTTTGAYLSNQVLPPDGIYRTQSEKGELVRLEIKDGKLQNIPDCKVVRFTAE